jgi:hypothetical protein
MDLDVAPLDEFEVYEDEDATMLAAASDQDMMQSTSEAAQPPGGREALGEISMQFAEFYARVLEEEASACWKSASGASSPTRSSPGPSRFSNSQLLAGVAGTRPPIQRTSSLPSSLPPGHITFGAPVSAGACTSLPSGSQPHRSPSASRGPASGGSSRAASHSGLPPRPPQLQPSTSSPLPTHPPSPKPQPSPSASSSGLGAPSQTRRGLSFGNDADAGGGGLPPRLHLPR